MEFYKNKREYNYVRIARLTFEVTIEKDSDPLNELENNNYKLNKVERIEDDLIGIFLEICNDVNPGGIIKM